jgi:hypothetical protein
LVQGYLRSYKKTFGLIANHHECNNDSFYPEDAAKAFKLIKNKYDSGGAVNEISFKVPKNTKHELSVNLALDHFNDSLIKYNHKKLLKQEK